MILCRSILVRFRYKHSNGLIRNRLVSSGCAIAALLCGVLRCSPATAQGAVTPLALSAVQAFNPTAKTFTSFTLSGTASWTAGSLKETGNVQLTMGLDGSTKEKWTLSTQSHSLEQTAFANGRACTYTDPVGKVHDTADANCFRAVPWFAPWMAVDLLPSNVLTGTDITSSSDRAGGLTVLQFLTQLNASTSSTAKNSLAQMQRGTAASVSYDLKTGLPSAIDYDYVLDSDPAHAIPYRIVFSDYRADAGFVLPHRIQRYVQRTLQADITLTSITAE